MVDLDQWNVKSLAEKRGKRHPNEKAVCESCVKPRTTKESRSEDQGVSTHQIKREAHTWTIGHCDR